MTGWVNKTEAVKRMGCSDSTFRRWSKNGELNSQIHEGETLYSEDDVEKARIKLSSLEYRRRGATAVVAPKREITGKNAERLLKAAKVDDTWTDHATSRTPATNLVKMLEWLIDGARKGIITERSQVIWLLGSSKTSVPPPHS